MKELLRSCKYPREHFYLSHHIIISNDNCYFNKNVFKMYVSTKKCANYCCLLIFTMAEF